MFGIEWSNLHVAGAFLVGAVFSAIVVLRLARIIAQFLGEVGLSRDTKKPPPDSDTESDGG